MDPNLFWDLPSLLQQNVFTILALVWLWFSLTSQRIGRIKRFWFAQGLWQRVTEATEMHQRWNFKGSIQKPWQSEGILQDYWSMASVTGCRAVNPNPSRNMFHTVWGYLRAWYTKKSPHPGNQRRRAVLQFQASHLQVIAALWMFKQGYKCLTQLTHS